MFIYDFNLFIDYMNFCVICNMWNNYSIYKIGCKYMYVKFCYDFKKKMKKINILLIWFYVDVKCNRLDRNIFNIYNYEKYVVEINVF